MPKQSSRGRSQDRSRGAGGQDHEVRYKSGKLATSKTGSETPVKDLGNSRKKVEAELDLK